MGRSNVRCDNISGGIMKFIMYVQARRLTYYTEEDVAKRMKVTKQTVINIENGNIRSHMVKEFYKRIVTDMFGEAFEIERRQL